MTEPTNAELLERVEQLERMLSGVMVEILNRTEPGHRPTVAWGLTGALDPDSQFGRDWATRAKAIGLTSRTS